MRDESGESSVNTRRHRDAARSRQDAGGTRRSRQDAGGTWHESREAAAGSSARVSILDQPYVSFGRDICGELENALRREWLVANGLGGYASGTLAGVNTRRYHGLLVAALTPPVGRLVMVADAAEEASYCGERYALSTHEFVGGTIDPHGYQLVQEFALDGMIARWRYALGDAVLEVFGGPNGQHPNVTRLAVKEMPMSGKPDELMDAAGINARHIVAAVKGT